MNNSFHNIAGSTLTYREGLELALKEGYTHLYRWINSDLGWTFFAKNEEEAETEATKLYLQERGKGGNITYEEAEIYRLDYVDVITIEEELKVID